MVLGAIGPQSRNSLGRARLVNAGAEVCDSYRGGGSIRVSRGSEPYRPQYPVGPVTTPRELKPCPGVTSPSPARQIYLQRLKKG